MPTPPLRPLVLLAAFALALNAIGCARTPVSRADPPPSAAQLHWGSLQRTVRVTGTIVPAQSATLQVPELNQQENQLTLAYVAPSGTRVKKGQLVASFDRTQLLDNAADAQAEYNSLASQVRQEKAKDASDQAQQAVDLSKALADQGQARLELEKRPILTANQLATDETNLDDATAHVNSLRAADAWLAKEAAAKLRALELQEQEQQMVAQQAENDANRMLLRAPMDGMLALALPGYFGKPVPGMQLYPGVPLVRIFDPSSMLVEAQVSEVDLAWVPPHAQAQVRIDAYPGLELPAHLLRLNPVAISLLGTSIHIFNATFALDRSDPRALPDLNASLQISSGRRSGWLVPRAEVEYQNGASFVWRTARNGRRELSPVQVLVFSGPWIEIAAPWLGPAPVNRRGVRASP